MPNRAHMELIPEEPFARAAWLTENLDQLLEAIPLSEARFGWAALNQIEERLFPRTPRIAEALGGPLDPTCPLCGVETEEGTVTREGMRFHVAYQSCGHTLTMSEAELRGRVLHVQRDP